MFDVIVCDPPWTFSDKLNKMKSKTKRSAISQYPTLSMKDLEDLDVKSLSNPAGTLLVLWCPSTLLEKGYKIVRAWGFVPKQTFVWVKEKKNSIKLIKKGVVSNLNNTVRVGMGHMFRQSHELAIVATMGSPYKKLQNRSQTSVAFDLNLGHSKKPETLQDRLDIMFPDCDKLEMFARRVRPNWTVVGNEIDGKDIRQAIADLTGNSTQEDEQEQDEQEE